MMFQTLAFNEMHNDIFEANMLELILNVFGMSNRITSKIDK